MESALKLANSVQQADVRKVQDRVIHLEKPTLPPPVEHFHTMTWFAAFIDPGQEFAAREGLIDEGFSVFLPVRTRWNGIRFRTKRAFELPLLVRYLFVGVKGRPHRLHHDTWSAMLSVEGVREVLGTSYGEEVAPIRMPVENLVQLAGEIMLGLYDETKDTWQEGESVRITNGTLSGFTATLAQSVPSVTGLDHPIKVITKMLGKENVVNIPLADLQRST